MTISRSRGREKEPKRNGTEKKKEGLNDEKNKGNY